MHTQLIKKEKMSDVKTFFKDKVAPVPSFTIKPTMGTTVGQPGNSADSGVSQTVKPMPLPDNSLWHDGMKGSGK